jgi:hypothetical protein
MNSMNLNSNNEYSDPNRRRMLEALDVCRPGSDDFDRLLESRTIEAIRSDADLTARYQRLQRFDAAVGRAFADAPVPAGLEARLMAALAADSLVSAVQAAALPGVNIALPGANTASTPVAGATVPTVPGVTVPGVTLPAPTVPVADLRLESGRLSRRRWMAACGAAGAATAAGLVGFWFIKSTAPTEITAEQLLDEAYTLHDADGSFPAAAIDPRNPPTDFPLTSAIKLPAGFVPRRRNLDGRLIGRPGVAYELAAVGQPRATLYVLGDRFGMQGVGGVPQIASGEADKTTGHRALGAWREGGMLYVFVVEGDKPRYRQFFAQSAGVFA